MWVHRKKGGWMDIPLTLAVAFCVAVGGFFISSFCIPILRESFQSHLQPDTSPVHVVLYGICTSIYLCSVHLHPCLHTNQTQPIHSRVHIPQGHTPTGIRATQSHQSATQHSAPPATQPINSDKACSFVHSFVRFSWRMFRCVVLILVLVLVLILVVVVVVAR